MLWVIQLLSHMDLHASRLIKLPLKPIILTDTLLQLLNEISDALYKPAPLELNVFYWNDSTW